MAAAIDWGNVPEWVVAVTAAIGSAFGVWQLVLIRRANESASAAQQDYLTVERANLLKAIDDKFESEEMVTSRKAIRTRLLAIGKYHEHKPDNVRFASVAASFSDELTALYQQFEGGTDGAQDKYYELMRLPSYIETMGWLWSRKLVLEDDLLDLYDSVIIQSIGLLTPHIEWRRAQRWPHNSRYLALAQQLYQTAIQYNHDREAPPGHRPSVLRDAAN